MTQETPEMKRGWENHQLSKSLRKMAEATEPPEDLRWIIVPDKQAAKLFARSLGAPDVGVLHPAESERLVEYAPSGSALCLVQEDTLDSERVLDMRI